MKPVPGFDMAWGEKPYRQARAQGKRFVVRYLSHDSSKNLSPAELREWHKEGIAVGVVWESTSSRALAGHQAGAEDARAAQYQLGQLRLPQLPVYFAVDFDATDQQKPALAAYMNGAASVIGRSRVGAYGGYHVIDYLLRHRAIAYAWQTYAWSGGRVRKGIHLYQHQNGVRIGSASCDLDWAFQANAGLTKPLASGEEARKKHVWARHLVSDRAKLHHLLVSRAHLRRQGKAKSARYAWTTTRMHTLKARIALLERLIRR